MIGEQIGNFKLISVLGQGGMGEVWLGEHAAIGTKVAIKMLLPHISANKEHVERFFNEAIAVGKIAHAGIVKIFDVGFHNGRAYLVMEFMAGESLAARIRRLGRLPLAMTSEIGRQISGVLEAVHKAGITHRDLKPDNIFLVADDELASGERVKVLDFGIAKLSGAGGGLTATASGSMGTPAYMSPEQWKNSKAVDWRADAYSLGCLAFEMASGGPPFPAETIGEACSKHLTEEPPRLASQVAVPAALDQLVAQLLAKSPDQRPSSMREIATRFGALAQVDPIGLATTQLSGHVAVPQLPAASASLPVARDARTLPSGSLDRLPPEPMTPHSMTPPPMHPVTTLGGAVASMQVAPAPKSKALLWTLIGAGAALAIVVVVVAISLGGGGGGKKHRDDDKVATDEPKPVVTTPVETPKVTVVEPPAPPPPAPPPPPPQEEPKPAGDSAAKPAPAASGFLTVNSQPFATIFVDGRRVGDTPLANVKLRVGRHRVRAVASDGAEKNFDVDIVADQTVKRQFTFERPTVAGGDVANKPIPSQAPPSGGSCDEVSCVLLNFEGTCCAKFKKGGSKPTTPVEKPSGDLPEGLDRAAISSQMAFMKGKVAACGNKSSAKGTVKVHVQVGPGGAVTAVTIKQTPDDALGSCVASIVRGARFPKSQTGGTFTYPFVF